MMSTPDISDKFPELPFLIGLNSYGAKSVFEGEVVTVVCPNDNSLAKELISQKGNGKILFIDGKASKTMQEILTLMFVLTALILSLPFGPTETRMESSSPLPSLSSNYIYN